MQYLLRFAVMVFFAVSGNAQGDDDACTAEVFYDTNCCELKVGMRQNHLKTIKRCAMKFAEDLQQKNVKVFYLVCLMDEAELLNADNQFNVDNMHKFLSFFDDTFRPLIYKNFDKCLLHNQTTEVTDFTRGSAEFFKCFYRESFLNCPSPLWSVSPECDELKANVTRCPDVYVNLMRFSFSVQD